MQRSGRDTCSCCCRASSICCCCFSSNRAAMFLCSEWAPRSCSLRPLSWLIIINSWSSFSARDSGVPGGRSGRLCVFMQDKAVFFFYSFLFRFCFSNVSNYHHYYTGGIKRYYSLLVLTVLLYNLSCFPIFPTKFLKT